MKQFLFFLLIALFPFSGFPQTTINKQDASGKKQGPWVKMDTAGRKIYEGQFKNNIPQGTFKYYYPNGAVKAVSVFSEDGNTTTTTTYFQNGKKNAEGTYVNEKREGLWKFFSGFDETLVADETYKAGIRNGPARTYYSGKTIVELINWTDGLREGPWIQYFDDGKVKLQGGYKKDIKEGPIVVFFPNGQKFNAGQYLKGYPDGKWLTYDLEGKLQFTDIYDHGVLIKTDKTPEPTPTEIKVKEDEK